MAGTFAPLAFLWLVLGYFQQQNELRLNTEALQLQADELRQSVELQREMVRVTQLQSNRDKPLLSINNTNRQSYDDESGEYYPCVLFQNDAGLATNVVIKCFGGLTLNYPEKEELFIKSWESVK